MTSHDDTETEFDQGTDHDQTIPPIRTLRFDRPADLYAGLPEVAGFTKHRPEAEEDAFAFFERLRASTTPEDAVTYTAFAAEPELAVGWGLEAVRRTIAQMPADEEQLLNWIAQWRENPSAENRWKVLQVALFAPRRSPAVYLGLAAGWSGGPFAPNDPVRIPSWRTPRAVNAAVLRSIGQVGLEQRSVCLARVLDLAAGLFRVY
ncbi:MAG: hypothetical protein AAFP13_15475 [Pseudomonadota bacterium]